MILDQVYMPYLFKKEKFYAWQRLVQIQKGMQIALWIQIDYIKTWYVP